MDRQQVQDCALHTGRAGACRIISSKVRDVVTPYPTGSPKPRDQTGHQATYFEPTIKFIFWLDCCAPVIRRSSAGLRLCSIEQRSADICSLESEARRGPWFGGISRPLRDQLLINGHRCSETYNHEDERDNEHRYQPGGRRRHTRRKWPTGS